MLFATSCADLLGFIFAVVTVSVLLQALQLLLNIQRDQQHEQYCKRLLDLVAPILTSAAAPMARSVNPWPSDAEMRGLVVPIDPHGRRPVTHWTNGTMVRGPLAEPAGGPTEMGEPGEPVVPLREDQIQYNPVDEQLRAAVAAQI